MKKNRVYLQWHITNQCNNRCKHCYQHLYDGINVNYKMAEMIIDDFMECCAMFDAEPVIAITGGDPMLNKQFWEILEMVKKKINFPCLSVLGNPELLTNEAINRLADIRLKHYQLSIDGMEATHDYLRHKGSFQKTISTISRLKKAGIPPYVMSTVSSINYLEMFDVMKMAYQAGAQHWMFARWIPPKGDCGISPGNYLQFVKNIIETHKKFENNGYKKLHKEPLISACKNEGCDLKSTAVGGGCGMGSSTITLLPDNTLMACRRHPGSVLGKWTLEYNFLYHFLENPKMEIYRQIQKIDGCNNCKFLYVCRGCRAAAYVATGNHFGKDPQCPIAIKL